MAPCCAVLHCAATTTAPPEVGLQAQLASTKVALVVGKDLRAGSGTRAKRSRWQAGGPIKANRATVQSRQGIWARAEQPAAAVA